jgi:hypothetical protein
MGNLLSEYRRRHNSDFIWASNDGVCFFNKNRNPTAICLLTDSCRAFSNCELCSIKKPRFVCEVLTLGKLKSNNIAQMVYHEHVEVDIDIAKVINELDSELTPYHAKNQNDIESWLWNFFLQLQPFDKYPHFKKFVKSQDKKDSNVMRSIDQMLWAALNTPSLYGVYYERLYRPLIVGRNYLLYR